MNTLLVRHVPDDVYDALKKRAAEFGTSISSETIRLSRRALSIDRAGVREVLAEIEAARPARGRRNGASASEIVRRDRDRR